MPIVFQVDPVTGKVALFEEAPGGGSFADPHSPRNRPLLDPNNWLANIYFHSDLDNLEIVSNTTITVAHAAVAATSSGGLNSPQAFGQASTGNAETVRYKAASSEHVLVTHNLGYIPNALIVVGSNVIWPGMPVQTFTDGRGRYVSAYVTTTQVKLHEWVSGTDAALAAVNVAYRVIVFKQTPDPSGSILFDFNHTSGLVQMARGRFRSDRNYLQVVPGGSPFSIAYGKTLDLKNGAPRFIKPDGSHFDPVPATQKGRFVVKYGNNGEFTYTGAYGLAMNYNGTAVAPAEILVQAP